MATKPQKQKTRNFVAKNARNMSGAGAHEEKKGPNASRARQKRNWKKEMFEKEESILKQVNDDVLYNSSDDFEKNIKKVEADYNVNLAEETDSDSSWMNDSQMHSFVEFVHEELLNSQVVDDHKVLEDALRQGLEDVAGFEAVDEVKMQNVIGRMVAIYNKLYR